MSNTTSPVVTALENSLSKYSDQLHGKRVWLGCSGGRDSLSLAKVCRILFDAGRLPFLPQLIHVNHGLQAANAEWAQYVQAWSQTHDMPCTVLTISLDNMDEQSARQARYNAMLQLMNSGDVLMLGHHSDDQVETVLMRLFNGAGVKGLSGMAQWTAKQWTRSTQSSMSKTSKTVYLWRPWLTISRAQITTYAHETGLDYIDDPTNLIDFNDLVSDSDKKVDDANGYTETLNGHSKNDLKVNSRSVNDRAVNDRAVNDRAVNDRAWLRSILMPIIKIRYPNASEAIARSSELMQDASHIIDERVKMDLAQVNIKPHTCTLPYSDNNQHNTNRAVDNQEIEFVHAVIDIDRLRELSLPRQSALIHHWLSPTDSEMSPSKRLVDDILALCKRRSNNHQTCLYWHNTKHSYELRRYKNKLYRLHEDWITWLEIAPQCQFFNIKHIANDHTLSEYSKAQSCLLKSDNSIFEWQLLHIKSLFERLEDNTFTIDDSIASNQTADLQLYIEPLPRNKKLTFAHRQGSKSGKKLLQAIDQPSFMRTSTALVSLIIDSGECEFSRINIPLFIVAIDGVYNLDSVYTDVIAAWIAQHTCVLQLKVMDLQLKMVNES